MRVDTITSLADKLNRNVWYDSYSSTVYELMEVERRSSDLISRLLTFLDEETKFKPGRSSDIIPRSLDFSFYGRPTNRLKRTSEALFIIGREVGRIKDFTDAQIERDLKNREEEVRQLLEAGRDRLVRINRDANSLRLRIEATPRTAILDSPLIFDEISSALSNFANDILDYDYAIRNVEEAILRARVVGNIFWVAIEEAV